MSPERYQKICDIFAETQEIPRDEREDFLTKECGDDEDLRKEVESLLASDESSGDFISSPALEVAAEMLAEEKSNSKVGNQIGQYKIVSLLGVGGMGEVWMAEDAKLKRKIALKLLADVQNKDRLARFKQEAFAVSALNHPNIITIFDIGESEGQQFIATEYIEGKTLRQLIQEGDLSVLQTMDIAIQVCAALSTAHSAGIIHRDIKPENIMVRSDGIVKILDFGLAKLNPGTEDGEMGRLGDLSFPYMTMPGMVMGTVNYMSPEQAHGLPIDGKTDVFSVGIVLYEMLGRELPFKGINEVETITAILEREPKPLSDLLSETLRHTISKSLKKEHLERPTASEMLEELRASKRDLDFGIELERKKTAENLNEARTIATAALNNQNALAGAADGLNQTKKSSFRLAVIGAVLIALSIVIFLYFQFWAK